MPEKAEQLDLPGGGAAQRVPQERDADVNHAGEDVQGVEAGDHVEGAGVGRAAEDEPFLAQAGMEDAEVLGILPDEEGDAQRGSEAKEDRSLAAITAQRGVVREDHRDAGGDEHGGEERAEDHAQVRLARMVPGGCLPSEDAVREEQAEEGESVGDEEDPHGDLPRAGGGELRILRPDDRARLVTVSSRSTPPPAR